MPTDLYPLSTLYALRSTLYALPTPCEIPAPNGIGAGMILIMRTSRAMPIVGRIGARFPLVLIAVALTPLVLPPAIVRAADGDLLSERVAPATKPANPLSTPRVDTTAQERPAQPLAVEPVPLPLPEPVPAEEPSPALAPATSPLVAPAADPAHDGAPARGGARPPTQPAAPAGDAPGDLPDDRPGVVVRPFETLSGKPEDAWIGRSVQQTLIADLTKARDLRLLDAGDDRYSIAGQVHVSGDDVRITGHITDTRANRNLGVLKITGSRDDLFAMQDELAEQARDRLERAGVIQTAQARYPDDAGPPPPIEPSGPLATGMPHQSVEQRFNSIFRRLDGWYDYSNYRLSSVYDRYYFYSGYQIGLPSFAPIYGRGGYYGPRYYGYGYGGYYPTYSASLVVNNVSGGGAVATPPISIPRGIVVNPRGNAPPIGVDGGFNRPLPVVTPNNRNLQARPPQLLPGRTN